MLPKSNRISKSSDFAYIRKQGVQNSSHFGKAVAIFRPSDTPNFRFGFILGKKVGKAYIRNKIKRELRAAAWEIIREYTDKIGNNEIMISYIVYPSAELDYTEIREEFRKQIIKLINYNEKSASIAN
jgi:ribonuclease P protein component